MTSPTERRDLSWWSIADKDARTKAAFDWCRRLEKAHGATQRDREAKAIALYEGKWVGADTPVATIMNGIQQVGDSFVSDITREKVAPQFQTRKADWEAQDQAQTMRHIVETDNAEDGLYGDEGFEFCRDGVVIGEGAWKLTIDYESKRVIGERFRSSRLFADSRDARLGRPRCWGYFDGIAPEVLTARWPDFKDEVERAEQVSWEWEQADANEEGRSPGEEFTRRVMVYEVWHLPSKQVEDDSKDEEWKESAKHDGRHMILIGGPAGSVALVDEKWPLSHCGITLFRPERHMVGWHGFGKAERLENTQLELNNDQARISLMMKLFSRLYFIVSRDAHLELSKLTNDFAGILEVDGDPRAALLALATNIVPPELFTRSADLSGYMRDYSGKTELTMQGKLPTKGEMSGIAIEHLIDQDSIRNNPCYKRWEECFVEIAKQRIDFYSLLASRAPGWQARWNADNDFGEEKWSAVSLKKSRYRIRPQPVNLLPSTPAGQIDAAVKLIEAKALPPSALGRVLGERFADIGKMTEPESAALNCAEAIIARVVKAGKMTDETLPNELMDLATLHRLAIARYNQAVADGVKSDGILSSLKQLAATAQTKLGNLAPTTGTGGLLGAPQTGPSVLPLQSQLGANAPPTGAAPPPIAA